MILFEPYSLYAAVAVRAGRAFDGRRVRPTARNIMQHTGTSSTGHSLSLLPAKLWHATGLC